MTKPIKTEQALSSHDLSGFLAFSPSQNTSLPTSNSSIIEVLARGSLLDAIIDSFPGKNESILADFAEYISTEPENTQRAYLTDITGALVAKWFHFWDYPTSYNPIAKIAALLHALARADELSKTDKIDHVQKVAVLSAAFEIARSDLIAIPNRQIVSTKSQVLEQLLGTEFRAQNKGSNFRMQLRTSPKDDTVAKTSSIKKEDRKILEFLFAHFNEQMTADFWAQLFHPLKIAEIKNFWLKIGNSENTVARKLSSLYKFEKYLFARELLSRTVIKDLDRPRIRPKNQLTLSESESEQLLKFTERACKNLDRLNPTPSQLYAVRNRAMLHLLDVAGIRATALCELRLRDIDLDRGMVTVREKGRKELTLPILEPALAHLREHFCLREKFIKQFPLRKGSESYLFTTRLGDVMTYRSLSRIVDEQATLAGIKKGRLEDVTIGAHAMRRSMATQLRNNGATTDDIKDLLGHSSPGTTAIYTRAATAKNEDVLAKYHPRARSKG